MAHLLRDAKRHPKNAEGRIGVTQGPFLAIPVTLAWAWAGSEFLFFGLDRNVDSIRPLEGADIVWIEEARRGCTGTRSANDQ